jgi:hypothetical protein
MKWKRSALASNMHEDVYFSEDWGELSTTDQIGGGVWLTVCKHGFRIVDCNPEYHKIIASEGCYKLFKHE